MVAPSSEARAQHYIPQFYLKGFTDGQKRLWVCEKFKPIRPSRPKDEAHRPDYYTHADRGERDETAEDILEQVESKAARIICKLANPQYVLTPENAGHVIMFVAFLFARVPSWRENIDNLAAQLAKKKMMEIANDKERFHRTCLELEKQKNLGMGFEELRQHVLNDGFEVKQGSIAFKITEVTLTIRVYAR